MLIVSRKSRDLLHSHNLRSSTLQTNRMKSTKRRPRKSTEEKARKSARSNLLLYQRQYIHSHFCFPVMVNCLNNTFSSYSSYSSYSRISNNYSNLLHHLWDPQIVKIQQRYTNTMIQHTKKYFHTWFPIFTDSTWLYHLCWHHTDTSITWTVSWQHTWTTIDRRIHQIVGTSLPSTSAHKHWTLTDIETYILVARWRRSRHTYSADTHS